MPQEEDSEAMPAQPPAQQAYVPRISGGDWRPGDVSSALLAGEGGLFESDR